MDTPILRRSCTPAKIYPQDKSPIVRQHPTNTHKQQLQRNRLAISSLVLDEDWQTPKNRLKLLYLKHAVI